jgi:murein DD-endopeptidase MepM/ murein hydrolase activator NlpD
MVAQAQNMPAPTSPAPPPLDYASRSTQGTADRTLPEVLQPNGPRLGMPIAGVDPRKLTDNFQELHEGHKHEALDIMASRGTPVLAVAEGNVAKLFTSKQGGLAVYQFDNTGQWCYYYAHLDHYAPSLKEGTLLRKGDVLGYVGTTGDAPANAPHLHFAVFKLGPDKKWWAGTAIDPLPLLQ